MQSDFSFKERKRNPSIFIAESSATYQQPSGRSSPVWHVFCFFFFLPTFLYVVLCYSFGLLCKSSWSFIFFFLIKQQVKTPIPTKEIKKLKSQMLCTFPLTRFLSPLCGRVWAKHRFETKPHVGLPGLHVRRSPPLPSWVGKLAYPNITLFLIFLRIRGNVS